MKVIEPSYEILSYLDGESGAEILKFIERISRTCYKSEDNITEDSASKFVKMLIKNGHEAMIEHVSITVKFICDRGVSHEIVRHRIASYAQESTRYCDYSGEVTFIKPCFWEEGSSEYNNWDQGCLFAETIYKNLRKLGASPQEARAVLPNSVKTELVVTMNLREWRHFFKLRCDKTAHPQMRELTIPLLCELHSYLPEIFDDIFHRERGDE
jgi:thymidylate synthase (FAD)